MNVVVVRSLTEIPSFCMYRSIKLPNNFFCTPKPAVIFLGRFSKEILDWTGDEWLDELEHVIDVVDGEADARRDVKPCLSPSLVRRRDVPVLHVEGFLPLVLLLLPLAVHHPPAHLIGVEDGHFAHVLE